MDRYSTLYATNQAGGYSRLGSSPKLRAFLERRIGAADVTDVVEAVEQVLRVQNFVIHPGYGAERTNNKPVAIRYAPMHLYKKKNMPDSMREFCALGVNGAENRNDATRVIFYTHTHMFPVNLMVKSGEYNYLDQLFGTRVLTSREVELHRAGKHSISFDTVPDKVYPVIYADRNCVFQAVEALYEGKNVVIRLEEGAEFNTRAKDVLMQIYSLLQPRKAVETGFATYQNVAEIPGLCKETSIRIFVVPAGVKVDTLEQAGFAVLDLSAGAVAPVAKTPFTEALKTWAGMDWSTRQPLMETLFAGVEDIDSPAVFVDVTNRYFQAKQELADWVAKNQNSLTSLEALATEANNASFWKALPDPQSELKAAVSAVLAEGVTIEGLNAMAKVEAYFAPENKKKGVTGRYKYGAALGGVNVDILTEETAKRQKEKDDAAHKKVLEDIKAKVDLLKEQKEAEIAEIRRLQEAEKVAFASAEQALKEAHAKELKDVNDAHAQEMADATAAHAAALTAAKEAHRADLEKAKKLIDDQKVKYEAERQQLIETHAAAIAEEQAKTGAAVQKVRALETDLTAASAELNTAKTALSDAAAKNETLELHLNKTASALRESQSEAAELKGSIASIEADRDNAVAAANAERDSAVAKAAAQDKKLRELEQTVKTGRNMKELIICAAAGLLVGALLMGIIWAVVGAVAGGGEETIPSTIPVETTLPVETTTAPTETEPVETTVPPTEPTEPALDEINWTQVLYYSGMTAVEDDASRAENLLGEYVLDADAEVLAVVTSEEDGFGTYGTVLPESFAVLMLKSDNAEEPIEITPETTEPEETTEPAEAEDGAEETTESEPVESLELSAVASMVLEGEHYRLIVVGEGEIQQAGLKLFALVNPEQDADVSLSMTMADGSALELGGLLAGTLEAQPWWIGVQKVSLADVDLQYGQAVLASSRTPIAAVFCGEGTVFVYDYTDDAEKAAEMLTLQQEKNRNAAECEGLIAVCVTAE